MGGGTEGDPAAGQGWRRGQGARAAAGPGHGAAGGLEHLLQVSAVMAPLSLLVLSVVVVVAGVAVYVRTRSWRSGQSGTPAAGWCGQGTAVLGVVGGGGGGGGG